MERYWFQKWKVRAAGILIVSTDATTVDIHGGWMDLIHNDGYRAANLFEGLEV